MAGGRLRSAIGADWRSGFELNLDRSFAVELGEWLERVAAQLELAAVVPAFYLPPQADRKRLSVLLMDQDGNPRAYAKISWAPGDDSMSRGGDRTRVGARPRIRAHSHASAA